MNTQPLSSFLKKERGTISLLGPDIDRVANIACEARKKAPLVATDGRHLQQHREEYLSSRVVPPRFVSQRIIRDGSHWHMTIVTRHELRQLVTQKADEDNGDDDSDGDCNASCTNSQHEKKIVRFCQSFLHEQSERGKDWFVLGIGRQSKRREWDSGSRKQQCYFLVCCYPKADALRKRLGLPPKDFHVTLGFDGTDIHDVPKGITTLFQNQPLSLVLPSSPTRVLSTHLDLIEEARIVILGGKPSEVIDNSEVPYTRKGRFQHANVLLDAAEDLIHLRSPRSGPSRTRFHKMRESMIPSHYLEHDLRRLIHLLSPGSEGEKSRISDYLEHDPWVSPDRHTRLIGQLFLMRCQILGRKRDFDGVIDYAEMHFELEATVKRNPQSNPTDIAQAASAACGYKGVALSMKESWDPAYAWLIASYRLYQESSVQCKDTSSAACSRRTRESKCMEDEAAAIERALAFCCSKIGFEPPIPPLVPFPRTAHLFDTGGTAVSSDDLVVSGNSCLVREFCNGTHEVVLEEKIDGANLGFSLSASGEILAQNRSHYVSGGDHHQFGRLESWISEHRSSLVKVLTPSDQKPRAASQGLILFGEWCVARHSIPYGRLPGYFIAFDLYDRQKQKFYSRKRFHDILRHSGIPCVPVIEVKKFGPYPNQTVSKKATNPSEFESHLRLLLDTRSRFRIDGGTIEGVVLRIDDGNAEWLEHRMKVVRPDFVHGITEHWTRRNMEKQTIDPGFAAQYCSEEDCSLAPPPPPTPPLDAPEIVPEEEEHGSKQTTTELPFREPIDPRRRLKVSSGLSKDIVMPRNFSFLWEQEVAITSIPTSLEQVAAWNEHFHTTLVVTLMEEKRLPDSWFENTKCQNLHVPIPNYRPPTLEQMDRIVESIERAVRGGGSAVVHCGGGKGRAGTVGACLLLKFGTLGVRASHGGSGGGAETTGAMSTRLSSSAATTYIRKVRPGSIETSVQESFVRSYANVLWRRSMPGFGDLPTEGAVGGSSSTSVTESSSGANEQADAARTSSDLKPPPRAGKAGPSKTDTKTELERKVQTLRLQRKAPRCIVCMGLPGSGKSTFADRLAGSFPPENSWLVINQDKLGRKECERLAGKSRPGTRVILDRCNPTASDRAKWLELMRSPPRADVSLVCFTADASVCKQRVKGRENHETIPRGRGGRIVSEMAKKLELPSDAERKRFGSIHFVSSFDDAEGLLFSLGAR